MMRLPGNRSRTRTQAMSVPIVALMRPTSSDRMIVSLSVAAASAPVMAAQNCDQPPSKPFNTTKASGMITSTLR